MRQAIRVLALLPAALLLAACQKDTDPGPGGVTVGEARALDEAAEMLEQRPAPPLDDATVPAERAAPPSAATQAAATLKPAAKPGAKPAATPSPKPAVKPKPKPAAKATDKQGAKPAAQPPAEPTAEPNDKAAG